MGVFKSDIELIRTYFGDGNTDFDTYVSRHCVRFYDYGDYSKRRDVEIELHETNGVVSISAEGIKFAEIDRIGESVTIYRNNIRRCSNWYLEKTVSEVIKHEIGYDWNETNYYGKDRVLLVKDGRHLWTVLKRFRQTPESEMKHMILVDSGADEYRFTFDGRPLSANLIKYNTKGQVRTKW